MRGPFLAGLIAVTCLSGCSMFPRWMHPGNLWKLNGHEPGGRDTMYFSVPDPPPRRSPDHPSTGFGPEDVRSALPPG